jgi:hypothetical protein
LSGRPWGPWSNPEEFATERYAALFGKSAKPMAPEFWENEILDLKAGFQIFCDQYYAAKKADAKKAKAKQAMKAMKAK